MHKRKLALACALLLSAAFVHADEAEIKKKFNAFVSEGDIVESVSPTKVPGLYEVVLKTREVVYTDEKFSYIFSGHIIDTATRTDLTQAKLEDLNRINPMKLPLDRAIKTVKGDGSRFLVTFEDPNCGFCKRLHRDLQQVDNVTIYTFLSPLLGPDSVRKSKQIWCAKDRNAAWNDWIVGGKKPAEAECDESSVIDQNIELSRQLGVAGTPTIFLANGKRIGGYLAADKLEEEFAAVAKEGAAKGQKKQK